MGLGPLKDMYLRGCVEFKVLPSRVELRRANKAELLGFSVAGSRGGRVAGRSLRGGNGGGDVPSRGGRIGAFGACRAYETNKILTFAANP